MVYPEDMARPVDMYVTCSKNTSVSKHFYKEHLKSGSVNQHVKLCGNDIAPEDVNVLGLAPRGETNLLTFKALLIIELRPYKNTQGTTYNY